MVASLIVSIGMPRAGSGWHYNLIHDLVVASGGKNAHQIRTRFLLQPILTEVNCNIGAFTAKRLIPVLVPAVLGNKFVIKAHAGPTPFALKLIQKGWITPIYIYRDPRDALLSAFEYGKRKRDSARSGAFSELTNIPQSIDFMKEYVRIAEAWLDCAQALHCRYEDLLLEYPTEVDRLAGFLGFGVDDEKIQNTIDRYQPKKGSSDQKGTHFREGVIGRYKEKLTKEQIVLCNTAFGSFLDRMSYHCD